MVLILKERSPPSDNPPAEANYSFHSCGAFSVDLIRLPFNNLKKDKNLDLPEFPFCWWFYLRVNQLLFL